MFRWYEDSFVCFAFLSDIQCIRRPNKDSSSLISGPLVVVADTTLPDSETLERNRTHGVLREHLFGSRWFRRGWTLQELIAPHTLRFYDQDYFYLFLKGEVSHDIMIGTGIDTNILENRATVDSVSVAQRMSWASWRETSRVEDRAYSLLGIFGVNMAMIYGEGEKAFARLQEEIIRASDDDSIFAWETVPTDAPHSGALLASSPDNFASAAGIVVGARPEAFELTNGGLRIELPLRKAFQLDPDVDAGFAALLNCHYKGDTTGMLALRLSKSETSEQFHPIVGTDWTRLAFDASAQLRDNSRLAFVSTSNIATCPRRRLQITRQWRQLYGAVFQLMVFPGLDPPCGARMIAAYPMSGWDVDHRNFRTTPHDRIRAGMLYECLSGGRLAVVFGYDVVKTREGKARLPSVWAHHYYSDLQSFPQFCNGHSPVNNDAGKVISSFYDTWSVTGTWTDAEAEAFQEPEIICSRISNTTKDISIVQVEIKSFANWKHRRLSRSPADSMETLRQDQVPMFQPRCAAFSATRYALRARLRLCWGQQR